MKRAARTVLTLLASAFVGLQLGVMQAVAQTGSGLQVQPPRAELTIERGEAATFDVTLKNISDGPVLAKYEINDFESDGVSGDPKIIIDSDVRTSSSIVEYLVDLEDISLEGNESKTFTVTAQIPDAAPPGAYYGLLRYQALPVDEEGQVDESVQFSLNASLGILVLIEVPGNVSQGAEVLSVSAQSVGLDAEGNPNTEPNTGSLFGSSPNQIAVEVRNTGGSFIKPFGRVVVKNMLGNVVAEYEMNDSDPRGNVLPNTTRVFTDVIEDLGSLGRYTIEANIAYTQGGEVITKTGTYWVIPIWFVIVVLVLLAAITYALYRTYQRFFG